MGKSIKEIVIELNTLKVLPPTLYKSKEYNYNYEIKEKSRKWTKKKIDIIYDRNIRVKKNKELNLFSGHLKCSECNKNLFSFKRLKNGKME